MTDHAATQPHQPDDIADEPHGPVDDGDDHGHDAHGTDSLGPIDVSAWGALALGIGLGLVVAFCVAVSTGAI